MVNSRISLYLEKTHFSIEKALYFLQCIYILNKYGGGYRCSAGVVVLYVKQQMVWHHDYIIKKREREAVCINFFITYTCTYTLFIYIP